MGIGEISQAVGALGQTGLSFLQFGQKRKKRKQEELDKLSYLDPKEWGQLRPDEGFMGKVLERLGKDRGAKELGEKVAQESIRYTGARGGARARGDDEAYQQTGFDPEVYQELLEWARREDPGLFQNLTGGTGQEVLRGYVPGEGAVGPDPSSTDPEVLQALAEEGDIPTLPEAPTAEDIARLTTQFDYPRAEGAFAKEVEQTESFGQDVEALLGRDGALQGDITGAYARGQAAVGDIMPGVEQAVRAGQSGIQTQIEALQGDISTGMATSEARRSRAMGEFTDDTASRIEQQRLGMQRSFEQDTESMMQEMQAQGMSQRQIQSSMRDRAFGAQRELASMAQQSHMDVARRQSELGQAYDEMTAGFQTAGLGEMGAARRGAVQAEVNFAQMRGQAVEATAKYQMDLDRSIVGMRAAADSAFLTGMQNYGAMLSHLSRSMPQAAQYALGAYQVLEYDDLASQAQSDEALAALMGGFQTLYNFGTQKVNQDIQQEQIDAQNDQAMMGGMFGLAGSFIGANPIGG